MVELRRCRAAQDGAQSRSLQPRPFCAPVTPSCANGCGAETMQHRRISGIEEIPTLSPREKECILWTAKGKSSWEIGHIIGISVNTVNFHIKNVMKKMDTASRTAAAVKALQSGIIKL
ncbi:LuxR family transcriptional regulator [Mesorhizobium sp. M0579]|uniref:helix-turn-helix transcriptional regulator n=1 Tax=Mesorhizobium sp. M0579 TaxID=2956962 RepID=UPI00333D34BC